MFAPVGKFGNPIAQGGINTMLFTEGTKPVSQFSGFIQSAEVPIQRETSRSTFSKAPISGLKGDKLLLWPLKSVSTPPKGSQGK